MKQFNLKCRRHPNRVVSDIYVKEEYMHQDQPAISKSNGFLDIIDVLDNPLNILQDKNRKTGIYDELNIYFQYQEQDTKSIIQKYIQELHKLIDKLEIELISGNDKQIQFQEMLTKTKQQFREALHHEQFKKEFEKIEGILNHHQSQEWVKFEQAIAQYCTQFQTQDNQEIKEAFFKIQSYEAQCFNLSFLQQYNNQSKQCLKSMMDELSSFSRKYKRLKTRMFDNSFSEEILNNISQDSVLISKLIYRGSQDGMSPKAFMEKCQNQGPTLTICKSANQTIFGGYSPCKWIKSAYFQQDQSMKSFLFNYNRREFYPIKNSYYSIQSRGDSGPVFGEGRDLMIDYNFKEGHSNLGSSYSLNEMQADQKSTILMGGLKPDLIEIEVYLIESL